MNLNNQFDTLAGLTINGHILARMRENEYATKTQAMKNVEGNEAAEMFAELGPLSVQAVDDNGLLRVVVSPIDLYDVINPVTELAFGIHAHVLGQDVSGTPKFYLSADDGHIYGIDAEIAGTLTIGTGSTAGGWFINSTQIFNDSISLDSSLPAIKIGAATDYLTGAGVFMGKNSGTYKMHIGDPAGHYVAWNGSALSVSGQWITGAGMNPSLQTWKTNLVFSATSANAVSWGSGTITLNDGTNYSISSGSKTSIAALTYLYLDTAVSTTALQNTTTYSTAVGSGKILIAAVQNNTTSASILPFGGQQPIIDGGAQIAALSILAGSIAAGAITASKISVTDLAAINANMGTLTVNAALTVGAGGDFRMGATGTSTGTGVYGNSGGWYSVLSNVQQTTFTSAGLSAAAGKTVLDINGLTFAAPSYTGTVADAVARWIANDNSANIGRILGTYGGAAVNSGLIVYGRGHDVSMNGFAVLTAEDYLGTVRATFNVVSDGTSTLDFTGTTTKTASGQSFTIKSKSRSADNAAINEVLAIVSNSAGSVANGFGSALTFYLSNSTPADKQVGYLGFKWLDKTAGSEDGQFFINSAIGGTATDLLLLDGTTGLNVLTALNVNTNKFTVAYSSGNTTIAGTLSVTGHPTLEGVTSTGATGTGKMVFSTSPALATPDIGIATATSLTIANGEVRSGTQSMPTDTAISFTPNKVTGLIWVGTTSTGYGGFYSYNTGATGTAWLLSGGANAAAASGVLAGTTGATSHLTVSAHTDGKIYIENRSGGTRNIIWLLG